MDLTTLIKRALEKNASDIHLVTGLPPSLRVAGEIVTLEDDVLLPGRVKELVLPYINEEHRRTFEREWKVSFSTEIRGTAHVRISLYFNSGMLEAAIRIRPMSIKKLAELGIPKAAEDLAKKPFGLVLVAGATGDGKTTTLYGLIDMINSTRRCKIITVEDPIEYQFKHNKSIIVQQEVGRDAKSFDAALMHILRLDPDVICIGEMRDAATIATALTAAETGHLVIGTIHTSDAPRTVDRIIGAFPSGERSQVSLQLSSCLQGIVAQTLLPTMDKRSRVAACEVMIVNEAIRNTIREGNLQLLSGIMQSGREIGMVTRDASLRELYKKGVISLETATAYARNPKAVS